MPKKVAINKRTAIKLIKTINSDYVSYKGYRISCSFLLRQKHYQELEPDVPRAKTFLFASLLTAYVINLGNILQDITQIGSKLFVILLNFLATLNKLFSQRSYSDGQTGVDEQSIN